MAGRKNAKLIRPLYSHWTELNSKEIRRLLLDFEAWCAEAKIIINKEGHAVPLILNEAQKILASFILKHVFAPIPEPVTLVIHKSRQMGISVLIAAVEQYAISRKKNLNLAHLLPDEDLANGFFNEKWQPLAEGTHPQLLPDLYPTTTPVPYVKVGDFCNHSMNCNIRIGGAGSRAAGRSGTWHVVVMDEYAFYENVSNLERGILATQPKTGMAMTIYVSTANGMNHFYDVVSQAKQTGSRIKFLFLPWHMLKEYEMEPKKDSRFYDLEAYVPTGYDMKLMDIFEECGYPAESWMRKLCFYDYVLDTEAKGDQDYMFENYPSTEDESFEATGRPVLPSKAINHWIKQENEHFFIDQFSQENARGGAKIVMLPTNRSSIKCYAPPRAGIRYALWCDPSEGEYTGDRSAGVVVRLDTMEEVCSFTDYIEQTELAELLVNLAKHYNNAQIVVERNMGQVCIEFIKQIGYPRMWIDQSATTSRTVKYGTRMTAPMKNEAIKRFRFLLNKGIYKPHDMLFLEEAQHFSWRLLPGGAYRAEATGSDDNGVPYHDDTVMCRLNGVLTLDMRKFKGYMEPAKRAIQSTSVV